MASTPGRLKELLGDKLRHTQQKEGRFTQAPSFRAFQVVVAAGTCRGDSSHHGGPGSRETLQSESPQ